MGRSYCIAFSAYRRYSLSVEAFLAEVRNTTQIFVRVLGPTLEDLRVLDSKSDPNLKTQDN